MTNLPTNDGAAQHAVSAAARPSSWPVLSRRLLLLGGAGAGLLSATGCAVQVPAHIDPVRNFDVQRYMGTWYALARIEQRFERGLTHSTAVYTAMPDGTVQVVNRGYNAEKGEWTSVTGKAKFVGSPDVAALKVSFFGPFYGGYNVVWIDPDYQVALVVGSDMNYFWLLSRTKTLPPATLQQLLQRAQSLGVDLNAVMLVPQQ